MFISPCAKQAVIRGPSCGRDDLTSKRSAAPSERSPREAVRHGRGARTGEHREYANQSELPFASSFIIELLHHPAQSPFSLRALPSMSLITIRWFAIRRPVSAGPVEGVVR